VIFADDIINNPTQHIVSTGNNQRFLPFFPVEETNRFRFFVFITGHAPAEVIVPGIYAVAALNETFQPADLPCCMIFVNALVFFQSGPALDRPFPFEWTSSGGVPCLSCSNSFVQPRFIGCKMLHGHLSPGGPSSHSGSGPQRGIQRFTIFSSIPYTLFPPSLFSFFCLTLETKDPS